MDINLPKWSRIVISGKDVTENQAAKIILRTDDLFFTCNDNEWRKELYDILEIKIDGYDEIQNVRTKLEVLDLDYLCNRQIASSYIFGPHGWCSWDGTIGCDGYNIGKYPSIESVLNEWKIIANQWKFLDLKCQLWDGEYGEETSSPLVEYIVKNGEVTVSKPEKILFHEKTVSDSLAFLQKNGERGCTINQFKDAVKLILKE